MVAIVRFAVYNCIAAFAFHILLHLLLITVKPANVLAKKETFRSQNCVYAFNLNKNLLQVVCGQGVATNFTLEKTQSSANGFKNNDVSYIAPGKKYIRRTYGRNIEVPRIFFKVPENETVTGVPNLEWIRNNSKRFTQIESKLISFITNLNNVSQTIKDGNMGLKRRLRKLTQIMNDAGASIDEDEEAYLSYLQNQQYVIGSYLVLQNRLLTELTTTVNTLTQFTHNIFEKMLNVTEEHEKGVQYLGRTLVGLKDELFSHKMSSIAASNFKDFKGNCGGKELAGIGEIIRDINIGVQKGCIMRDVIPENSEKTWLMYGYSGSNTLVEYDTELALRHELVSKTYELPFYCEGTGHVVYKNALYCLKAKTNIMIRYELGGSAFIDEYPLDEAGVHDSYPYQNGILSDVDFAVDESGLWVVYSTIKADGKIVVSKLNDDTMELEKTWVTNFPKNLLLNTFMICGVLYGVEAPPASKAFIRYQYDTKTGVDSVMGANRIVLPTVNTEEKVNVAMLDYNAMDKNLYVWNDYGHVETYPVLFRAKG